MLVPQGTNQWCTNHHATQEVVNTCSIVPDPAILLENCLAESQYPSHVHQFDGSVFHEYENATESPNKSDKKDTNLTLHLRLETLNLNVDIPDASGIHPQNSTNNFCQIPNKQPQIDCTTPTFS